MKSNIKLIKSWLTHLEAEFQKPYMKELKEFLKSQKRDGINILPKSQLWFNALNSTPLEKVRVVIIGQDPYPNASYAHGLSFSILPDVKPLPKSLQNINIELKDDLGVDNSHSGYLQPWAEQGVLLLNAVLTLQEGRSNSHQNRGWEEFTDKIIEIVDKNCDNVVFLLWGGYAQKKGNKIDSKKHLIIKTPHPSPLSAYRGFFGSKPFSKTNNYLVKHNKKPINWQL
jgi:uracil-DNA glycosylase